MLVPEKKFKYMSKLHVHCTENTDRITQSRHQHTFFHMLKITDLKLQRIRMFSFKLPKTKSKIKKKTRHRKLLRQSSNGASAKLNSLSSEKQF